VLLALAGLCTETRLEEHFPCRHVAPVVLIAVLNLVQTEASRNCACKSGAEQGFELCLDELKVGDWVFLNCFGQPICQPEAFDLAVP